MAMHGGRIVAQALRREGVPYVFTLCGGHIMSIYDGCLDEGIGVIDVRHEQSAAHAADGWARVTGQPGVALVTAGPGTTDAVTGVATAWRANIPIVVIGGQAPRFFQDMGGLQDMPHVDMMRPITKWAVSGRTPGSRRAPSSSCAGPSAPSASSAASSSGRAVARPIRTSCVRSACRST